MHSKQALVFGASGISGWAITRGCLNNSSQSFDGVVAVTKRPFEKSEFMMTDDQLARVHVASGIDLSANIDEITEKFKLIPGIANVTHVFYTAYGGHGRPLDALKELNVSMLRAAVTAVRTLCPIVESWNHQTGGKIYGYDFFGQPGFTYGPAPVSESLAPIPDPFADQIFYHGQLAIVKDMAAGSSDKRPWRVVEVRPDVVVGFTPHDNGIGFGVALGLFLALFRHIHGQGAVVPFPGNEIVWNSKRSESSQDVLARFHIHTALHPDSATVDGRAFNIADEDYVTWSGGLWKDVCGYFGLIGGEPNTDDTSAKGVEWVMANKDHWAGFVEKNSLRSGCLETASWETATMVFGYSLFDRQFVLDAARSTGFEHFAPTVQGYMTTFDRMKKARVIP